MRIPAVTECSCLLVVLPVTPARSHSTINAGNLSPEQSEAAIRGLSDAGTADSTAPVTSPPNLAHYVSRDIRHGRAVDCNLMRLDGWFTRRELALILSLMPDDREDFGQ